MWGASLIPIGSVVGRLIVGIMADRFEKRRVAVALFLIQGFGILAFSFSDTPVSLFISTGIFGLTIGSIFMLQSLITADLFGIPSFGRIFGAVQLCSQLASSSGPLLVGWLFAVYGNYAHSLRWLTVASLLAGGDLDRVLDVGLAAALWRVDASRSSRPPRRAELEELMGGLERLPTVARTVYGFVAS